MAAIDSGSLPSDSVELEESNPLFDCKLRQARESLLPTIGAHAHLPHFIGRLSMTENTGDNNPEAIATDTHFRYWKGEIDMPVVIYLHGIEGHGLWFENTASLLCQAGLNVFAPDRRGSGLNQKDRGHVEAFADILDDLRLFVSFCRYRHPRSRIVIWANCWGAKPAAILASRLSTPVDQIGSLDSNRCGQVEHDIFGNLESSEIKIPELFVGRYFHLDGLIFSSPAIHTIVDFDLETKKDLITELLLSKNELRRMWPIPVTASMLTNNPSYIEYLSKDRLRLTAASASFFIESHKLTLLSQAAANSIKCPTLILQSGSDRIVDIDRLERWYAKIGGERKAMRIFAGASHSLDFDEKWFEEYSQMGLSWISSL